MSFFRLKIYVNLSLKGMQVKVEVLPLIYYEILSLFCIFFFVEDNV